jgi:hypothetical protein
MLALAGVHPYNPLTGINVQPRHIGRRPMIFGPVNKAVVQNNSSWCKSDASFECIGQEINSSFPEEFKEPQE